MKEDNEGSVVENDVQGGMQAGPSRTASSSSSEFAISNDGENSDDSNNDYYEIRGLEQPASPKGKGELGLLSAPFNASAQENGPFSIRIVFKRPQKKKKCSARGWERRGRGSTKLTEYL